MDIANLIVDGAVGISPLEGEMAGRPEGVASAASASLELKGAVASRAVTPSVAFGDISPSRGESSRAIVIVAETAADIASREALLDRAMGPMRRKKSSEKLR